VQKEPSEQVHNSESKRGAGGEFAAAAMPAGAWTQASLKLLGGWLCGGALA
jgi:hypothetical protein